MTWRSVAGQTALFEIGARVEMVSALDKATEEFGQRLALVNDGAWSLATPCSDWDVHFLVAHVVGGNRFAVMILDGWTASNAIEEVMSTPQLGGDAMEMWTSTASAQASAFQRAGALEQRIDHPLGEMTGREFLDFRVFDLALHAWDLARSIGVDEQLDPELVSSVLAIVENGPKGMGFGIAALGLPDVNAAPQARLLDLTGRA